MTCASIRKIKTITLLKMLILLAGVFRLTAQVNYNTMSKSKNPLLCDTTSQSCEIELNTSNSKMKMAQAVPISKPIRIIYFTDPICSACWGIEPQLKKMKLEYGSQIEIEYRMGGLLPDWNYNSGGINKPSDVALHWDEASQLYGMPIDGNVWLEDPLHSSFPPSIAFKAAQLQGQEKALLFLRELREMVFLHKKNIAQWEQIESAAKRINLNLVDFKTAYEHIAIELFNQDLQVARNYGVRGFPALFFENKEGIRLLAYGYKPYNDYEQLMTKLVPTIKKTTYNRESTWLFNHFATLTAKEYSVLAEVTIDTALKTLDELTKKGVLNVFQSRNGSIWNLK